ncbi:ALG2 [Acanthosepion pharaonis]|uniref:Alpha-1,3/1,6-mannosyltransferase ALG2 n=1 Tax=Acanthosepion pharaonis TaxID=158019 RepID=A0A812DFE7_ACAPH|nr:ALG2 [Sepia pharaonis]
MLLTGRETTLKSIYRAPLDWFEEITTGMADRILVNSNFTAGVFRETFKRLSHIEPAVLYPTPNFALMDAASEQPPSDEIIPQNKKFIFLSINRYERKKNLDLALYAFMNLEEQVPNPKDIHLIMAGGYDERYQNQVTVFIVGHTTICEQKLKLINQLNEFFLLHSKLFIDEAWEEQISIDVDIDTVSHNVKDSLTSAAVLSNRLSEINKEMVQYFTEQATAGAAHLKFNLKLNQVIVPSKLDSLIKQNEETILELKEKLENDIVDEDEVLEAADNLHKLQIQDLSVNHREEIVQLEMNHKKSLLQLTVCVFVYLNYFFFKST